MARGRKENGKKRGKKAGRSRGGTTRRRIWSSCRRGEGRRRGREKSFEARFFFGGQEARNWQSAKKEIVGKVVWLAEARPNRKRGAPCRLSETRYYYYSRRRKFRIPARSTFLARSSFFFLARGKTRYRNSRVRCSWIKINDIYLLSFFLFPRITIRGESEIAYHGICRVATLRVYRRAIFRNRLHRAPR